MNAIPQPSLEIIWYNDIGFLTFLHDYKH